MGKINSVYMKLKSNEKVNEGIYLNEEISTIIFCNDLCMICEIDEILYMSVSVVIDDPMTAISLYKIIKEDILNENLEVNKPFYITFDNQTNEPLFLTGQEALVKYKEERNIDFLQLLINKINAPENYLRYLEPDKMHSC